jgi:hypothetical protein
MPDDRDGLSRLIRQWGWVTVFFVALQFVLSFGFAGFAPLGLREGPERDMFIRLAHAIPVPPSMQDWLERYFTGASFLAEEWVRGSLQTGTSFLLLVAFLVVLRAVIRADRVSDQNVRALLRFAIAIALIRVVTYPVFTTDFWLSVGWGRMIVAGQNPYYADLSTPILEGLPIGMWGDRMTYGPLWGILSGGLAWLGSRREWLEFLLFKAVLAAAWIGTLVLLRKIAGRISLHEVAVVTCLFGWMPMSSQFALAEGHNDIALVAPLVLWLYLLLHQRWGATSSLVGSILIKYVSAPLLAVDLLAQRVLNGVSWRRYLFALIPSLLFSLGLLLLFARDRNFLTSADQMRDWTFWTPSTALLELGEEMGFRVPGRVVNLAVQLSCVALIVFYLIRFLRARSIQRLFGLVLAILVTVLFTVVGHVWPWFMLWALPLAVLTWRSPLAWFVLILGSCAPFLNLHWLVGTDWALRPVSGLLYYAFALIMTIWVYAHYRLNRGTPVSSRGL